MTAEVKNWNWYGIKETSICTWRYNRRCSSHCR